MDRLVGETQPLSWLVQAQKTRRAWRASNPDAQVWGVVLIRCDRGSRLAVC